jgi:hypothetical protein
MKSAPDDLDEGLFVEVANQGVSASRSSTKQARNGAGSSKPAM